MSVRSTYQPRPEGVTLAGAVMIGAVFAVPFWVVVFLIVKAVSS